MTERTNPDRRPDAPVEQGPRTATTAEEAMRQEAADRGTPDDTDAALLEDTADEQAYAPEDR